MARITTTQIKEMDDASKDKEKAAEKIYEMADAMIKEREK